MKEEGLVFFQTFKDTKTGNARLDREASKRKAKAVNAGLDDVKDEKPRGKNTIIYLSTVFDAVDTGKKTRRVKLNSRKDFLLLVVPHLRTLKTQ